MTDQPGLGLLRAALLAAIVLFALPTTVAQAATGACRGTNDTDTDGVQDCLDNCPAVANDQNDTDGDAIGDVCDCDLDVDTTADGNDGECATDCTLREAIDLAPSNCMLRLGPGTYALSTTGRIEIERGVAIVGSGAGQTIVAGARSGGFGVLSNVLEVVSVFIGRLSMVGFTQAVTLDANQPVPTALTVSNVVFDQNAAALRVSSPDCCFSASATMNSCTVIGGASSASAIRIFGAEQGSSTLIVNESEVEGAAGGAIAVYGSGLTPLNNGRGTVELNRSTVHGSTAATGAGIGVTGGTGNGRLGGRLVIRRSTVSGNTATGSGGGLWIGEGLQGGDPATADVSASTISSNTAGTGAGIHNRGQIQLFDSTIVSNQAAAAGGGLQTTVAPGASARNTIFADNTDTAGAPDCAGALTGLAGGHNLIENPAGCSLVGDQSGNQTGIDPGLKPLGDYGGPTRTHAPLAGSSAIDTGSACAGADQRGVGRPMGADCDIGAVEDAPDADDDGVPDPIDSCPADPTKTGPGQCGCGVADDDQDFDGTADCVDGCPTVPGQTSPDPCACGFDVDADEVCDGTDNCPGLSNPSQVDSDADGRGDGCDPCPSDALNDVDADGFCAAEDNCLVTHNPLQADADGDGRGNVCDVCPTATDASQGDGDADGRGDACDCEPADPTDLSPGAPRLLLGRIGAVTAALSWSAVPGADGYSIDRGDLSALGPGSYGGCLVEGLSETGFSDDEIPLLGDGFTYLVVAQNHDCGLGSLGFDSTETERVNTDSAACTGEIVTDSHASGEQSVAGSIAGGSFVDTHDSDDVLETLQEQLSQGGPAASRFSLLDHRFTFAVPPGGRFEFHVEGLRSDSTDGDDFAFEYFDGASWILLVSGLATSCGPCHVDLVASLPPTLAGSVTIRVVDTNRDAGAQTLDMVSIDEVFVRGLP